MDRQEKIQYLKEIAAGRIRIERPKRLRIEASFDTNPGTAKYFIDDVEVTTEQWDEYCGSLPAKPNIWDDNVEVYFDRLNFKDPHYDILRYMLKYKDDVEGFRTLLNNHPHISKQYDQYLKAQDEQANED